MDIAVLNWIARLTGSRVRYGRGIIRIIYVP